MSFFDEYQYDHGKLALLPSEFSEYVILAQATKLRATGYPVTALVLETIVKRMRADGDKSVAEFFACLDEDILEETKDDIYSHYH